jgi:hypothetical protein
MMMGEAVSYRRRRIYDITVELASAPGGTVPAACPSTAVGRG